MKLSVTLDGETYSLDVRLNGALAEYTLSGGAQLSGTASVMEVSPGVFSILLGTRSFTVHLAPSGEAMEAWTSAGGRHAISVADARDRLVNTRKTKAGPVEVRAQMPGKVIKILVSSGESVASAQGLIVVEAMKMQNEMKTPKPGKVGRITAIEGATVAAGELLMIVE